MSALSDLPFFRSFEDSGASVIDGRVGRARADESLDDTTILVVAPNALVRDGLRSVIGERAGLSVVGEADGLRAAVSLAMQYRPHAVLLDEPPTDSIDRAMLSTLRRELPTTCVLCLARRPEPSFDDVLCVPSDADIGELCSVLGAALGGRCAGCALQPTCAAPKIAIALSPREKQVAVCIARGMASKRIAGYLGIGLRTVSTYRESLARKLGASSAAVVTRFVLEAGLDTPGLLPYAL